MSAPIPAKSMGTALSRVDGRFKVTGAAKYPAEFNPPMWLMRSSIREGVSDVQGRSTSSSSPFRKSSLVILRHVSMRGAVAWR